MVIHASEAWKKRRKTMSTLYENTMIVYGCDYDKIKDKFENYGMRVQFDCPRELDDGTILVTFGSNGSHYCGYEDWFVRCLDDIIAYEETCIEDEPYFFAYINGEWQEGETSILREYYPSLPIYFNEADV